MADFVWPAGQLTALVTPLRDDRVDLPALEQLVERQITAGVTGLVVTGGTGEYGALTFDERCLLFSHVVRVAAGRVTVVAQTGCLATADALRLGEAAQRAGVGAMLVASPFGEPINWRERYAFYRQVSASASVSVMVYNTPPAGLLTFDQIRMLAELPGVTAVKDSSGDPELMGDLLAWARDAGVAVYVGKDSFLFEAIAAGARGAIFGVSNFIPGLLARFVETLLARGLSGENLDSWYRLRPLLRFMERGENYVALCKVGCRMVGLDVGEVRAPYLVPAAAETDELRTLLERLEGTHAA